MIGPVPLRLSPAEAFARCAELEDLVFLDSALADPQEAWSWLAAEPSEVLRDALPPIEVGCSVSETRGGSGAGGAPPFRSGWIGFLAYEFAPRLDPLLVTRAPEVDLPLARWARYDAALAHRHADGAWFVTSREDAAGRSASERWVARIAQWTDSSGCLLRGDGRTGSLTSSMTRDEHARDVETIREWIARGHIYQANLTYRLTAPLQGNDRSTAQALYAALRRASPAPFGSYLSAGDLTIQSSSPELFLRVRGRSIETRPIKGTRPRAPEDPRRDAELREELLASEKDRAELVMIVDLERNDLGRIAAPGSVRVGELPELASYATVHHLFARVHGTLASSIPLAELTRAVFPGGSVTGAPKYRAMEILAELETVPRFVYCGALGWIDDRGDLEWALPIRTLWIHRGRLHFGVGGGIVTDSRPDSEWEETLHKAGGLRRALQSM